MSIWDSYGNRLDVHGTTKREATLKREVRLLRRRAPDSLSYHTVTVFDSAHGYNIDDEGVRSEGYEQNVTIINSDNLNEKKLHTMPGEDMAAGSLIEWMGNHWLVTEKEANTTIYTTVKLEQCNYLLRWVSEDDRKIYEQWCIIEDGTKYLTGELEDRHYIVSRGDSRLQMTIAITDKTTILGRTNRFLIDDPGSQRMMAYTLSKPFKLGGSFNGEGVYRFVLQEVQSTDFDSHRLRIADYYKYFPREVAVDPQDPDVIDPTTTDESGRQVWL